MHLVSTYDIHCSAFRGLSAAGPYHPPAEGKSPAPGHHGAKNRPSVGCLNRSARPGSRPAWQKLQNRATLASKPKTGEELAEEGEIVAPVANGWPRTKPCGPLGAPRGFWGKLAKKNLQSGQISLDKVKPI